MEAFEKIRLVRELNQWSQEEMAEKLKMSPSGYARIERGETRLNLARLEQIATVFGMEIWDLMRQNTQGCVIQINNNDGEYDNSSDITFYGGDNANEIARLKLMLQHKDELLAQKSQELETLKEMFSLLKKQIDPN